MRPEVKELRDRLAFRDKRRMHLQELLALNAREIVDLNKKLEVYFNEPPPPFDLPPGLADPAVTDKLAKMPLSKKECSFCGSDKVRQGKKFRLCQECGNYEE